MAEKYEESKPKTFKFGMVGDNFWGVFLKRDKTTNPDKYGKTSFIYTVRMIEGSFHDSTKNEKTGKTTVNDTPTIIAPGDEYAVFVNVGTVLAGKMNDLKLGQRFKVNFAESKDTGKGNDAKIIKVFPSKDEDGKPFIDPEWAEENVAPVTLDDM